MKTSFAGVRWRYGSRPSSGAGIISANIEDDGLTIGFSSNFTGGADPASFCGTDPVCLNRQSTVFIDLHASAIATAHMPAPRPGRQ
jgi:hypothetical protein